MKSLLTGLLIFVTINLSGCLNPPNLDREPLYSMADNQLLWDKYGCAYFIKPGRLGDVSFVMRYYAGDKDKCLKYSQREDKKW